MGHVNDVKDRPDWYFGLGVLDEITRTRECSVVRRADGAEIRVQVPLGEDRDEAARRAIARYEGEEPDGCAGRCWEQHINTKATWCLTCIVAALEVPAAVEEIMRRVRTVTDPDALMSRIERGES